MGIRRRTGAHLPTGSLDDFTFFDAPYGHFYADPFIIERDRRAFVFFEDYSYLARSATLACSEVDLSCEVLETRTVVRQPYHMSYPHVFSFDGNYYMIPETGSVNRVELYRAVPFPWEWTFEKVLLNGVNLLDTTYAVIDGTHWILAGGSSGAGNYDQLHLFHAPTLFDRFQPHPGNPVKTDPASTRPAGALLTAGDRLIRPAQDCGSWYGRGLTFMSVDVISDSAYSESPVAGLPNRWLRDDYLGTHTYGASEHFEVVDACSYGPDLPAIVGRARSLVSNSSLVKAQTARRAHTIA